MLLVTENKQNGSEGADHYYVYVDEQYNEKLLSFCATSASQQKAGWLDGWMDAQTPFGGKHEAHACLHNC